MTKIEAGMSGKPRCESKYNIQPINDFVNDLFSIVGNSANITKEITKQKFKTRKLYFAGPWFDERSNYLYRACEEIVKLCDGITDYEVFYPKNQVNEKPLDAFIKNVSNVQDCDVVVALVDKKDSGTAWEIGMAYGLNKQVLLLGYDETTFLSHTNVMLAFTGECITLSEFVRFLTGQDYKAVTIKNEWEGVE